MKEDNDLHALAFERQFRTPHSEGYFIKAGSSERIGRVDLHFASDVVYATLVVEVDVNEDGVLDMIEQIDESLVLTADVPRDDFLVTVYRGKDLGFYSDDFFGDEEEDAEGEETDEGTSEAASKKEGDHGA
jgi:hypothetical protein